MKTLLLTVALLVSPTLANAQTQAQKQCSMEAFNDQIVKTAKGEIERAVIWSLLVNIPDITDATITEDAVVALRETPVNGNDDIGERPHIEKDYVLTISNVRIQTVKGNVLVLNPTTMDMYSKGAKLNPKFDNEGVQIGQSCDVSFDGVTPKDAAIVNSVNNHQVPAQISSVTLGFKLHKAM